MKLYLKFCMKKIENLHNSIISAKKINDIILFYKNHWTQDPMLNMMTYADWLHNDLSRWMNNDESPMKKINSKYRHYASVVLKVRKSLVNTQDKIRERESHYGTLKLCKMYLHVFDCDDLDDCILFLKELVTEYM